MHVYISMAWSSKVLNQIFKNFELKTFSYEIFYALFTDINKIFIFATVFRSTVCEGDIFQFSIKICKRKKFNSSYNH